MLEPERRHLLLDALRPPHGYTLDRAIGTTFSLDLAALLAAPVGFALLDRETVDGRPVTDPIALLEAVRRHADRIDIFCQAGMIALPEQYRAIVSYLETSVHEVAAFTPGAIFHPKVWLIRFRPSELNAPEGDRRYRFLCLSRNLTFDRAWDTVLRLEGASGTTRVEANEPLARFARSLPEMAVRAMSPDVTLEVERLADEVESVRFELPEGFDGCSFWPLGIDRRAPSPWPFQTRVDRLLVISPFLTAGCLRRLERHRSDGRDVLVSRPESLDAVGGEMLTRFAETLTLSGDADAADQADGDGANAPNAQREVVAVATEESLAERPGAELRGLHAKLYVADAGRQAYVWTGSANATDAAFGGNVEFLVRLDGRRDRCGIDAVIGGRDGALTLRSLLEPYTPLNAVPREHTPAELLERRLDEARRTLASLRFAATVRPIADQRFTVRLTGEVGSRLPLFDWSDLTVHSRPLSMLAAYGRPVHPDSLPIDVEFDAVSFEGLTSFFVFHIAGESDGQSAEVAFLVNAPLTGAPADRRERILVGLLSNRGDFLRFLLFLLGGQASETMSLEIGPGLLGIGDIENGPRGVDWQNLFEPMVRALAADHRQLDDIERLVRDIRRTEVGRGIIPPDFNEIWEPIWAARNELATR